MEKGILIASLVLYLFISSFAASTVFGSAVWEPGIDFNVPTHSVSFASDVNISAMNLEIVEGSWVVENGNLTSQKDYNFFILKDPIKLRKGYPLENSYTIYNMSCLTRFTVYYGARSMIGFAAFEHAYWEMDIENDVIHLKREKLDLGCLFGQKSYEYVSTPYQFGDSVNCEVVTYLDKPPGAIWTNVLSILSIDGEEVSRGTWRELMSLNSLSSTGGVYCECPGLRIGSMTGLSKVGQESISIFDNFNIMLKIMLFKPPTNSDGTPFMPFWLNFILFKIPAIAVGGIALSYLRGV